MLAAVRSEPPRRGSRALPRYLTGTSSPAGTNTASGLPSHEASRMRVTSTRASLKHAPPPRSVNVAGASAVAVDWLNELRRHSPLARLTVPSRMASVTSTRQCTSPSALNTRTASPVATPRAAASPVFMCSTAGRVRSSPSVELIVFSVAGEISARG